MMTIKGIEMSHSMAEIPRERILETFLLKQTDSALEFFLFLCLLNCPSQWLGPRSHSVQVSSKSVSRRKTKSRQWNILMETQ